jgi:hypothetical protein
MRKEPWFRLGWILSTVAGMIPLAVGLANYFYFILSMSDSHSPWQTPLGRLGFSLQQLRAFRSDLAANWVLVNQVGWANLVMSGITVVVASWAGIRRRSRWSWFLVLFGMLWVGANDLNATLILGTEMGRNVAMPLIPMTLGVAGLALSARGVFSSSPESRRSGSSE